MENVFIQPKFSHKYSFKELDVNKNFDSFSKNFIKEINQKLYTSMQKSFFEQEYCGTPMSTSSSYRTKLSHSHETFLNLVIDYLDYIVHHMHKT